MTTLLDSANSHDVSSNESAAALHNLRNALNGHKNITIQSARGEDLTRFYVGSLAVAFSDRPAQQDRSEFSTTTLKEEGEVIKTLHTIARQNTDPEQKMSRAPTQIFSRTTTGMTDITDPAEYEEDMDVEPSPASFLPPDDRPAVVITDDRKVRAEVGRLGSAAIAGWMIKKWLIQAKKSHNGQTAPVKHMDVDPPMDAATAA
jgi:hypothetical protein